MKLEMTMVARLFAGLALLIFTNAHAGTSTGPAVAGMPRPLLAPPSVADQTPPVDLWHGAEVGMNVAQVERLFPSAAPPQVATLLTGGETDLLELHGVDLNGHVAVAHFYFRGGSLAAVNVNLTDLKPSVSAQNVNDMHRIASDLTASYGAEYDCGDKSESSITAYGCKWLQGPLSIRLWYMDVAGQAPLFYLAYRPAADPGYDL